MRLADATLHVRVSVPGEDAEAQPLAIPVGKDFFIETTNALQKYDDHAKINFSFGVDSPFFEDEDAIPLYCEEARVRDLCCRSCRSVLLTNAGERAQQIESFQLPSEMWNSFSDCIACEECFPLRMSKIAAKAGRVYWSHLYGLCHEDDVVSAGGGAEGEETAEKSIDLKSGKCTNCGCVVGDPVDSDGGVQLYKHKIWMPEAAHWFFEGAKLGQKTGHV